MISDALNLIANILTVVTGPAIGHWVAGRTKNPKTGLIVGLLVTPKILLVSFLIWTFAGVPDLWTFFVREE